MISNTVNVVVVVVVYLRRHICVEHTSGDRKNGWAKLKLSSLQIIIYRTHLHNLTIYEARRYMYIYIFVT